jgi:LysR family tcuABC transcriptional regulator
MELRQVRYFLCVVQHGGIGRAAAELGLVTSALSHQISRLESELATRLLQRTSRGVVPTDAGLAFWRQAQLVVRHADAAVAAAQQARLSGQVSVGFAPTTGGVLALPFLSAMRERYPDIRVQIVESLSGHLTTMLYGRQIDLAVLFKSEARQGFSVLPLLDERLSIISGRGMPGVEKAAHLALAQLADVPMVLPSGSHGLRSLLDVAFARAGFRPLVVAEIDGLGALMDAVAAGFGITVHPGSALARQDMSRFHVAAIDDVKAERPNLLVSLNDDELAPAGLAARVVLRDVAHRLVEAGRWPGASLH